MAATAVVLTAVTFTATAVAESRPLIAAIRAQDRLLNGSVALNKLQQRGNTLLTRSGIELYVHDAGIAAAELRGAALAVSLATAEPAQRQGQHDWVRSAREEATGFSLMQTGTRLVIQGHVDAGNDKLALGHARIKAGDRLGLRADKLLGLSDGD